VQVVRDVDLSIGEGEHHVLIGPNGAGKSTLLNLIAGTVSPSRGSVVLLEKDVTRLRPHQRSRLGLARTFQQAQVFTGLSVQENLNVATAANARHRFSFLHPWRSEVGKMQEVINQFDLTDLTGRPALELSHGERRQLEIAMALLSGGRVLLLDEPAAGLSPAERPHLIEVLRSLPRGHTVLMVEHDMTVAMSVADRVSVLSGGRLIKTGSPEEIRNDDEVRRIYLGVAA
jgi:branched-chain amino acid transport system ATP-binding protein